VSISAAGSTPTTRQLPGQRRRQHAGAAAKIEYRAAPLRQITAKVEILGQAILNVGKSKDRWEWSVQIISSIWPCGTTGRAHLAKY
jgi:hypothetical protein